MTTARFISELVSRYDLNNLVAIENVLRHLADYLPIASTESGFIPRDCSCQKTLLDCADAIRAEKNKLYPNQKAKVSA
jgi:hypothetical protein